VGRKKKKINIGNCANGCGVAIHCRGVCFKCYSKINYEEHERVRRRSKKHIKHPIGTIVVDVSGYSRIKVSEGHSPDIDWAKHHRYVVENKIGRKLLSFESIHHKNGVKSDNRYSNLEIWVTKQPKGQRPKDLIKYAKWILKTYDTF
jgi:hypothetical protein